HVRSVFRHVCVSPTPNRLIDKSPHHRSDSKMYAELSKSGESICVPARCDEITKVTFVAFQYWSMPETVVYKLTYNVIRLGFKFPRRATADKT
ncbi:MAG: hypothetical protein ACREUI_09590, partial [Burkholderiales bacterium]